MVHLSCDDAIGRGHSCCWQQCGRMERKEGKCVRVCGPWNIIQIRALQTSLSTLGKNTAFVTTVNMSIRVCVSLRVRLYLCCVCACIYLIGGLWHYLLKWNPRHVGEGDFVVIRQRCHLLWVMEEDGGEHNRVTGRRATGLHGCMLVE